MEESHTMSVSAKVHQSTYESDYIDGNKRSLGNVVHTSKIPNIHGADDVLTCRDLVWDRPEEQKRIAGSDFDAGMVPRTPTVDLRAGH